MRPVNGKAEYYYSVTVHTANSVESSMNKDMAVYKSTFNVAQLQLLGRYAVITLKCSGFY